MATRTKRQVTTLAPWYGSDRMTADRYAKALEACKWVGIPFAGGMSIVSRLKARTIVCNDLHRHMINLARVVRDPEKKHQLSERLESRLFHPDELSNSQAFCRLATKESYSPWGDVEWAAHFFYSAWVGRNGEAGGKREFNAPLSVRWNAAGGDSVVRYRSAVEAIDHWHRVFTEEKNVTFECEDALLHIAKWKDDPTHGAYVDPPFPGPGDRYQHNCGVTETEQREWHEALRGWLGRFKDMLIVCRFYDHPLVRELYSADRWSYTEFDGRAQTNGSRPEVMLVNRPA